MHYVAIYLFFKMYALYQRRFLKQSISIFIFYCFGLGFYGEFNLPMLLLVVVTIWVIQLFFSAWWMKKFYFGRLNGFGVA